VNHPPRHQSRLVALPGRAPEGERRHFELPARPSARIVTLLSGKGGVGTTNLAASLAISLARGGQRVLLLDADFGLSNLDLLMGVVPRHTVADLVAGRCEVADALVASYAGVRVLPGATGEEELANLDDFRRERLVRSLSALDGEIDTIVIDAGTGVGRNVTSLARLGGQNLVVTTPEPPAVSAAYGLLKILDRTGFRTPPGILVNQATGSLEARDAWTRISKACNQFLEVTPEWLGWIPYDPAVPKAVRGQEPFLLAAPMAPASKSLVKLAQRLLNDTPDGAPEAGHPLPETERMAG
jgi:flagellar biosynthesis protein FlhG